MNNENQQWICVGAGIIGFILTAFSVELGIFVIVIAALCGGYLINENRR